MALTNFRDISPPPSDMRAGFQFEFVCESCGETWKSPFKPYRAGQAASIFRNFGYLFNEFYRIGKLTDLIFKFGRASNTSVEVTGSKPKMAALEEAQVLASQRYEKCGGCRTWVCANCFNESTGLCIKCEAAGSTAQAGAGAAASSTVCPNCQTASQGGRFCHECGFDMASTHKSCPSCGTTMSREARFCTDCGHGF